MAQNIFGNVVAIEEPYEGYWAALGKFLHQFSDVERAMQRTLWRMAGVEPQIGRAVFSGVKVDGGASLLNRICDAMDRQDVKGRLEPTLAQLSVINAVRNNIVHWGATHNRADNDFTVTNEFLAIVPDRVRSYRVTVLDLHAMTADLHGIALRLAREEITDEEVAQSSVLTRVFAEAMRTPWLYRPRQQSPSKKKRPPKSPKHRSKRDASS